MVCVIHFWSIDTFSGNVVNSLLFFIKLCCLTLVHYCNVKAVLLSLYLGSYKPILLQISFLYCPSTFLYQFFPVSKRFLLFTYSFIPNVPRRSFFSLYVVFSAALLSFIHLWYLSCDIPVQLPCSYPECHSYGRRQREPSTGWLS